MTSVFPEVNAATAAVNIAPALLASLVKPLILFFIENAFIKTISYKVKGIFLYIQTIFTIDSLRPHSGKHRDCVISLKTLKRIILFEL